MRVFTAAVDCRPETGLYVDCIPGFSGAHSQGEMLDDLNRNLQKVLEMLLEDGEPQRRFEFVGVQTVKAR